MTDKKEIEEKYVLYQLLQYNLEQMKQQYNTLNNQLVEIEGTMNAVSDIEKAESRDVLVPIGSGAYAYAKLSDNKNLLFNVGANVMIKKDTASIKELLEKKKSEVIRLMEETEKSMNEMAEKINEVVQELQKLSPPS